MILTLLIGFLVLWVVLKILTSMFGDAAKGVNALSNGVAGFNAKMEAKLAEKMEQAKRDGHTK